jgi:hypothetical protein
MTIKIISIVDGDLLRNSIVTNDVLPKEFLDGGEGYVGYRLRFNQLGEVFYYGNDESVISRCEFTQDVYTLPL